MILPGTGRGTAPRQRSGGGASPYVPPFVERARTLRRAMSYPEVLLWQRLRGAPLGIRFWRQHPVADDIVVDFYCAKAKLAIEVDGEVHSITGALERDARRDAYLRSHDLRVVRVPAIEILRNADAAAAAIVALAAAPLHPSPMASGPPPRAGEDQESL